MNATIQNGRTTTVAVDGMTGGHCVQAVSKALAAVPGVKVKSVAVGSAVIETDDRWAAGNAVDALDEAGYPAKAVNDAAAAGSTSPAKRGGGCCGGAKDASGAKPAGGCCG